MMKGNTRLDAGEREYREYREHFQGGLLIHRAAPDARRLYIELTTRCGGRCIHCLKRTLGEPETDLPLALLEELFGQAARLPELQSVCFIGIGEPLEYPHVLAAIELAKQAGLKVTLSTNGQQLTSLAADLVKLKVDRIVVSCDSPEADGYGEIRGVSLAAIQEGLAALRTAKARAGKTLPHLGLEFVLMRRNLDVLPEMPGFARQSGVSSLLVTNLLPYSKEMAGEIVYRHAGDAAPLTANPLGQLLHRVARDWFTWGTVDLPRMTWGAHRQCRFVANKAAFITAEGSVTPCLPLAHDYGCFIFGQPKRVSRYATGDLRRSSLPEIWLAEDHVRFRARVQWFQFPSCVDCELGATCDFRAENSDCWGADPSCADCLWAQNIVRCP